MVIYLEICDVCSVEVGNDVQWRSYNQNKFKAMERTLKVSVISQTPDLEKSFQGKEKSEGALQDKRVLWLIKLDADRITLSTSSQ